MPERIISLSSDDLPEIWRRWDFLQAGQITHDEWQDYCDRLFGPGVIVRVEDDGLSFEATDA